MRKKYLIFMYRGPIDGWALVNYSDLSSCTVYDDEGTGNLEGAKKVYELIQNEIEDVPLVLVEVLLDNKVEQEYK